MSTPVDLAIYASAFSKIEPDLPSLVGDDAWKKIGGEFKANMDSLSKSTDPKEKMLLVMRLIGLIAPYSNASECLKAERSMISAFENAKQVDERLTEMVALKGDIRTQFILIPGDAELGKARSSLAAAGNIFGIIVDPSGTAHSLVTVEDIEDMIQSERKEGAETLNGQSKFWPPLLTAPLDYAVSKPIWVQAAFIKTGVRGIVLTDEASHIAGVLTFQLPADLDIKSNQAILIMSIGEATLKRLQLPVQVKDQDIFTRSSIRLGGDIGIDPGEVTCMACGARNRMHYYKKSGSIFCKNERNGRHRLIFEDI